MVVHVPLSSQQLDLHERVEMLVFLFPVSVQQLSREHLESESSVSSLTQSLCTVVNASQVLWLFNESTSSILLKQNVIDESRFVAPLCVDSDEVDTQVPQFDY